MGRIELTKTFPEDVIYPDSDGQPMAETGIHVLVIVHLIATLRQLFRDRDDVYVTGDMFLYYEEGRPASRKAPDVMVVQGVPSGPERRSFKVWVEGAVPCCILEITSRETADEDQEGKRELYQRLGVQEYFLFDPLHEYLERPLMGYRLVGEEYEELKPARDGGLVSKELGVRLVPEEASLALFRSRGGERIPAPPEAYSLLEDARRSVAREQQQVVEERCRAEQAEQGAEKEKRRAEQAEQRAAEAERELEQLRALLPPTEDTTSRNDGGAH
jgi:Uma2 family endonuclease